MYLVHIKCNNKQKNATTHKGKQMFIAKHKNGGELQLVAISRAQLRRHLTQLGQNPSMYDLKPIGIKEL